jgi:hypothetical protein
MLKIHATGPFVMSGRPLIYSQYVFVLAIPMTILTLLQLFLLTISRISCLHGGQPRWLRPCRPNRENSSPVRSHRGEAEMSSICIPHTHCCLALSTTRRARSPLSNEWPSYGRRICSSRYGLASRPPKSVMLTYFSGFYASVVSISSYRQA